MANRSDLTINDEDCVLCVHLLHLAAMNGKLSAACGENGRIEKHVQHTVAWTVDNAAAERFRALCGLDEESTELVSTELGVNLAQRRAPYSPSQQMRETIRVVRRRRHCDTKLLEREVDPPRQRDDEIRGAEVELAKLEPQRS
jgi:hypothetical protein